MNMRTTIATITLPGAIALFTTGLQLASSDSGLTPIAFVCAAILLMIGLVAIVPPILKSVSMRKTRPESESEIWTPELNPRLPRVRPVSNLGLLVVFGPIPFIVTLLVAEEYYPVLSAVRISIVVVCIVVLVALLTFYLIRQWLIPRWRRFKGDPYH